MERGIGIGYDLMLYTISLSYRLCLTTHDPINLPLDQILLKV